MSDEGDTAMVAGQAHPWQEFNAAGGRCHEPECVLGEEEHAIAVRTPEGRWVWG